MREFVRLETAILLRRLAFQVGRIAKSSDAESVHDLRVAIRRFSRCLALFSQFYPGRSSKKARRKLSELMKTAGAVRDLDIAIELLAEAGLSRRAELFQRLAEQRREANRQLLLEVRDWKARAFSKKWRDSLGLSA
jgi:CHAD domain-containing protein